MVMLSIMLEKSNGGKEDLTRIIHRPKKRTREDALGARIIFTTTGFQDHHGPKTTSLDYPGATDHWSHCRYQASFGLAASSGLQSTLRTCVVVTLNRASQCLLGQTHAHQQHQTTPQNRCDRARRGQRYLDPILALLHPGAEF